jgi:glycerophosphoryl diester phosphodiesterase
MRTGGWVALGVGGVLAVAATAAYWMATGGIDDSRPLPAWLTETPIAHRGLHSGDSRVPENSLAAFEAAADAGFGIELDVQITSDGHLVVLHDENLKRMTGVDRQVAETPLSEVATLRLLDSSETVPPLAQVLETVNGRVPVFVEVKNPGAVGVLEDTVAHELETASGPVAVMSFNPFSLARIAERAPSVPRGQLSSSFRGEHLEWWKKLVLGNMLLNFKSRPDFIAYQLEGLPSAGTSLQRRRGRPLVVWTTDTPAEYARAQDVGDAVIFELGARPDR